MGHSPCSHSSLESGALELGTCCPGAPVSAILISRLLQHLGRGMAELLEGRLKPFGLVEAECRVLLTLFSQPAGHAHPGELCTRTGQRPANMSRICDALVSRDLITRTSSTDDRRRLVLKITTSGEALVGALLPELSAPLHAMFADMPAEKQAQLIVDLKQLCARLDEARAPASADTEPANVAVELTGQGS